MGNAEVDQRILADVAHYPVVVYELADIAQKYHGDALSHQVVEYILYHSDLPEIGYVGIDDCRIDNE